ncbi:hypothetical protein ACLGL1_07155 [Peptococcus simiae]|uniref:hypothetical protein n=1 Tax=Peptococcus simiae TaxID=1643805 RepID=UPI0039809DA1
MQRKKGMKRFIASLLTAAMLAGLAPLDAQAAILNEDSGDMQLKAIPADPVQPGIATRALEPADWSITDKNQEGKNYWPLTNNNTLVPTSSVGEPLKAPTINYNGYFTRPDGRTVLRLTYRKYDASTTGKWWTMFLKVQDELASLIDFKNQGCGIYEGVSGTSGTGWKHDSTDYKNVTQFGEENVATSGSNNVYSVNLQKNNNRGTTRASNEVPINLVLKEGKTMKDVNDLGQSLIQMRLLNEARTEVYTDRTIATKDDASSYNAYTFSTTVGIQGGFDKGLIRYLEPNSPHYHSGNSTISYNLEQGYVEVRHHFIREARAGKTNGYNIGYRQVVDKSFYDLIAPQGSDNTIGYMYQMLSNGAKSDAFNEDGTVKNAHLVVPIKDGDVNKDGDRMFIQVVESDFNTEKEYKNKIVSIKTSNQMSDIFSETNPSTLNYGHGIIIRYYVDKDKLASTFAKNNLSHSAFYSTFIYDNSKTGTDKYEFTLKNDITLDPGKKINIDFDGKSSFAQRQMMMYVKGEGIDTELRSNFKNESRNRKFSYTVQNGMPLQLKAGTKITLVTKDNSGDISQATLSFEGNPKEVQTVQKQIDYSPLIPDWQDTLSAGTLAATDFMPEIDEIFTDSQKITGSTYYIGARIKMVDKKNTQFFDASRDMQKVTVGGKEYDGFRFENPLPTLENGFVFPKLEKDMPILFTNRDIEHMALESKPEVVEQVQAKVFFHHNDATRDKDETLTTKVVPLNEAYSYNFVLNKNAAENESPWVYTANPHYKPNGFLGYKEGDQTFDNRRKVKVDYMDGLIKKEKTVLANHNGGALEKKELKKREMPITDGENPEVKKADKKFLGWSTKKGTSPEEFRKAKELTKISEWENADKTAFKFTGYSPVDKHRDVYAVWGEGVNLNLHGNKAKGDTEVYTTNISEADLVYDAGDKPFVIDGKKYAKLPIPKVFYTRDKQGAITGPEKTYFMKGYSEDEKAGNFVTATDDGKLTKDGQALSDEEVTKLLNSYKDRYTFVGWTSGNDQAAIDRNMTLYNNKVIDGVLDQKPIENKINRDKDAIEYGRALLPNGGNLLIPVDEATGKASLDADIDLYAQYRPYYRVQIQKKTFDKNGQEVSLNQATSSGSRPDAISSPTVQIGLLHRTAVTELANPTVDEAADYYPISKNDYGTSALGLYMQYYKTFNPNPTDTFNWFVPGYDEYGQRLSYVGVELPVSATKDNFLAKTKANLAKYYAFYRDWNSLGATLLPRTSEDSADKYPGQRGQAKIQTLLVDRTHYGDRKVDTFTGATQRLPVAKESVDKNLNTYTESELNSAWQNYIAKGKYEVYGYNIVMTNREVDKYQPNIEPVQEGAKSFTMTNFFKDDEHDIDIEKIKGAQIEIKPKANSDEGKRVYHLDYNPNSGNLTFVADDVWRKTSADKDNSGLPTDDINKAPATGNLPTIEYQRGSRAVTITMPEDFEGFEANTAAFNADPNVYIKVAYRFNDTKADFYTPFTRRVDGINPTAKVSVDKDSLVQQASIYDNELDPARTEVDLAKDIIEANNPTHFVVDAKVPDPLLEKPAEGKTSYYLYRAKDLENVADKDLKQITDSTQTDTYKEPLASYKMEDRTKPIRFVGPIADISRMVENPANPEEQLLETDELVIVSVEEGKPAAKSDAFNLDLEGPKFDASASDGTLRLFVDLLAENLDNRDPNTKDYTVYMAANGQVEQFTDKENFMRAYNALERAGFDPNGVQFVAYDQFNNKTVRVPSYEATTILDLEVSQPRAGRKVVSAKAQAGATIQVEVLNGHQEVVATGSATVSNPNRFTRVRLSDEEGQVYALQAGDSINVKAVIDATTYSNPVFYQVF